MANRNLSSGRLQLDPGGGHDVEASFSCHLVLDQNELSDAEISARMDRSLHCVATAAPEPRMAELAMTARKKRMKP